MNLDVLIEMDDEAFSDAVLQAFKQRAHFPQWWEAVLRAELIDDTERVLRECLGRVEVQAADPARFPHAASFALKLRRGALAEVALARAVMEP